MPETAYALYVGIDWGTVTHQVAVLDASECYWANAPLPMRPGRSTPSPSG